MWTFVFSENEANEMAASMILSGKRAWGLLKSVDDFGGTRFKAALQTPILVIALASELRMAARRNEMRQFAVELRVRKMGRVAALEWCERGVWHKPSFRSRQKLCGATSSVIEMEGEIGAVKILEVSRK